MPRKPELHMSLLLATYLGTGNFSVCTPRRFAKYAFDYRAPSLRWLARYQHSYCWKCPYLAVEGKIHSRRRLERDGARCEWRQDKTIRTNYVEKNLKDSIGRGFTDNTHQPHSLARCCPIVVVHSSIAYCAKALVVGVATGLGMLVRYCTHRYRTLDRHLFGHSCSRYSYTDHCHTHYWSTVEGRG